MTTYVTFGQVHVHSVNGKTFDKDCVAVLESSTQEEGRKLAFEVFNGVFHRETFNEPPDMSYYPRGLIHVENQERKDGRD